MIWVVSLALLASLGNAIVCPGGQHVCPKTIFSESTCCQVPDGSYGCCPLPNAVCCDDHIHCCREGYVCTGGGSCEKSDQDVMPTNQSRPETGSIECQNPEFTCPEDSTCCKLDDTDLYWCCPAQNAVCCSDGIHCCPQGNTCDLVHQRCVESGNENEIEGIDTISSAFVEEAERILDIICPGGEYECPDGSTCCQLPSGEWGCCPLVQAVCCPDHLHCCPHGMKCDNTSHACHQGGKNITWLENKPASAVLKSQYVICPGGTYKCPDNTTCCQSSSGQWGCCPYADAVCCSDHKHCCPAGYRCDVVSRQCIKGNHSVSWKKKFPAKP